MTVNGHAHSALYGGSAIRSMQGDIVFGQEQNKLTFVTEAPGTHSLVVAQGGKEVCNLTLENGKTNEVRSETIKPTADENRLKTEIEK